MSENKLEWEKLIPQPGFSPTLPTFQTSWDSTSLTWLKQCPRAYQYRMLQGWTTASKSVDLEFGGLYAGGVERYARSRANGASHDDATVEMVKWAMRATQVPTFATEQECDGFGNPAGLEREATGFVHLLPAEDDTYKNRYTLVRSLVWNVEDRLHSPFKTLILANGKPAVELSFNFEAFQIDGEPITLCGHLDEVVTLDDGRLWVKDDKTTKSALNAQYFSHFTPHNQMSLYTIAGAVILERPVQGVLVRACQVAVGFNRYATQQVPRPKPVLDEWMHDARLTIQAAKSYAENDYWPMNDTSCFWCEFKKVCAVSPSHRQAHLEAEFTHRPWRPLDARGIDD